MGKFIDLTGQKFGRLTVIKISYREKNKTYWECQCNCKDSPVNIVEGSQLQSGKTKSCGCYRKEESSKRQFLDLNGKTFGRLKVIGFLYMKNNRAIWLCECNCKNKNIIEVNSSSLVQGITQSCGCLQKERASKAARINLVGKKYGKLTVVELAGLDIYKRQLWLCKCSCDGKIIKVSGNQLQNNKTKSCGCLSESWIASETKKYFIENYDALTEYKICKNPKTSFYLPFDVYLPIKNIYIEIHGEQHYKYRSDSKFYKSEKEFKYRQHLDKIKKQYAKKNGHYIEVNLRKIKTVEQAIEYIEKEIRKIK